MPRVTFIATTITSKGRFDAGQIVDFPSEEAKALQTLSTVESPKEAVKEKPKKTSKKAGDK